MCVSSKESTLPLISLCLPLAFLSPHLLHPSVSFLLCSHFWPSVENSSASITDKEKESSPSSLTNTHIHTIRNYSALWKLHEELAIIILQSTGAFRWSSRRVVQADAAERKVRWWIVWQQLCDPVFNLLRTSEVTVAHLVRLVCCVFSLFLVSDFLSKNKCWGWPTSLSVTRLCIVLWQKSTFPRFRSL